MKSLCALLLSCAVAAAATITGNLEDITGTPYSPTPVFTPLSTPSADGNSTVLDVPRPATINAGAFSITLKGGNYSVDFGKPNKAIKITVPNDAGTYTLNQAAALYGNSVATFSFPGAAPHTVWAGPSSGTANGAPSFRALASADLPPPDYTTLSPVQNIFGDGFDSLTISPWTGNADPGTWPLGNGGNLILKGGPSQQGSYGSVLIGDGLGAVVINPGMLGAGLYFGDSLSDYAINIHHNSGNGYTLQIPGGAGAGKVLTSDASGNATWQATSGGGSLPSDATFNSVTASGFLGTYSGGVQLTAPDGTGNDAGRGVAINAGGSANNAGGNVSISAGGSGLGIGGSIFLTPAAGAVVINGGLQIPAGAASGSVLSSDASGNASWASTLAGNLTFQDASSGGAPFAQWQDASGNAVVIIDQYGMLNGNNGLWGSSLTIGSSGSSMFEQNVLIGNGGALTLIGNGTPVLHVLDINNNDNFYITDDGSVHMANTLYTYQIAANGNSSLGNLYVSSGLIVASVPSGNSARIVGNSYETDFDNTGNVQMTGSLSVSGSISLGSVQILTGAASPPTVAAPDGSLYLSTGGSGTLYVRHSGAWVAK